MIVKSDTVTAQPERCDRIEETCGKPSESAVSEARLALRLFDIRDVLAVFGENFLDLVIYPKVDEVVRKKLSYKELRRDIVDLLVALYMLCGLRELLGELQDAVVCLRVVKLPELLAVQPLRYLRQCLLDLLIEYLLSDPFDSHNKSSGVTNCDIYLKILYTTYSSFRTVITQELICINNTVI